MVISEDNIQEKDHVIIYGGYLFKKKPKSLISKCLESNERQVRFKYRTDIQYAGTTH